MIEELKKDKEKTKAGITGVEIAARIIKECRPYCQGVHIMALGWESKVPDLLKLAVFNSFQIFIRKRESPDSGSFGNRNPAFFSGVFSEIP